MIRIALFLLAGVAVFALLRLLLSGRNLSKRQFSLVYGAVLVGGLLLYLGITGKLHPLFALLGAALPFVTRGIPLLLQVLSLRAFLGRMRGGPSPGKARTGQQSSIKTRYVDMKLDHDSGHMDGRILLGAFAGKQLSELDLNGLLSLLDVAREDGDSERVLRAYLDRTHPDWDRTAEQNDAPRGAGSIDLREAYEVLGLSPGASREDIIDAHRKLMQKMHPDRGGSTYLAARINDAKAVLLDHLDP